MNSYRIRRNHREGNYYKWLIPIDATQRRVYARVCIFNIGHGLNLTTIIFTERYITPSLTTYGDPINLHLNVPKIINARNYIVFDVHCAARNYTVNIPSMIFRGIQTLRKYFNAARPSPFYAVLLLAPVRGKRGSSVYIYLKKNKIKKKKLPVLINSRGRGLNDALEQGPVKITISRH